MRNRNRICGGVTVAALVVLSMLAARAAAAAPEGAQPLRQGSAVTLGDRKAVLTRLDDLPYVQSDYTKRFRFDSYDNPRLTELRERYRLDEVVAPGKDEFDRQVLLLDWVNHRFKKFGKPTSPARGALDVLAANDAGNTFFCAHYADVFVSAAATLGWVDRSLALRRPDPIGQGSTEHSSTEIWSNQYRKWVMLDPTFAMHVVKASDPAAVPLNAYELRQEWFYNDGKDLVFVLDKDRKRYRKSDLPVFRSRHAGFGDLVLDEGALNPYGFIGYIPNTNLMDAGPDYGKMFITKDKVCEGTKWHTRVAPADPARDPYFPIDQSALTLTADGGGLRVALKTLTPNFKTYLARIDGGEWKPAGEAFAWTPHAGANRLEVKTVNRFGVEGPVSTAEIQVAADEKAAGATPALEAVRQVEIGRNRELRVNGKPFFPISSWAQSSRRFELLRGLGFNTFCGGKAATDCDAAQKAGGYAMPVFDESVKGHPALLAYIQGDEPDLGLDKGTPRRPAQAVVDAYRRMRGLDDTRPIFLNLTSAFMEERDGPTDAAKGPSADRGAYYETVAGGGDILSFDVYPIYGHNRPDRLVWVADGVSQLRRYAGPAKPVFACIETAKGSRWITYERQLDVKPEHTRAEVWMAVIRGATGIVYFTHAWRPTFTEFAPSEEMRTELKRLNDQITRLAPAILADPAKARVSVSLAGGLAGEVMAKEYEGSLYLFADNLDMKGRGGVATFAVEGLKKGTRVEVLDEGRQIVAGEGTFADEFGPLAVHLYRIPRT